MSHSLIEIPRSEWVKLCDLYSQRRKDTSAYGLLQNYINWVATNPQINAKIYSLDGIWKDDGTFLLIDPDSHIKQVFLNTLNDNLERLVNALNCLNNKETYTLFGFQERCLPAVEQHLNYAGFKDGEAEIDATYWYHIDKEKALKFDIQPPEDITLSPLQIQHAAQVNEVWPHRAPGSIKFVKRMIRYNKSIGAFNIDGNLVAWCLRLPTGSLGLLQVIDTYKRKGLGNLVVRYMARNFAQNDEETLAPVVTKNVASRSMFEKLGFEAIDKVYWALKPAKEA